MKRPLYFDYAATTPVDSRVADVLNRYLTQEGEFGNPSSTGHVYGRRAREAVELARSKVANLINASPEEIIWTSGATEADNLAILGAARFYARRGKHIITLKTEHKAVLDPCAQLMREGFDVTYLPVQSDGLIDLEQFEKTLRDDTVLVSVMQVNNEIGVIQDIKSLGKLTRERGIIFHVDAAQAAGKTPIDVKAMGVDLMSLASHKIYGPKGVGALYVSKEPKIRLQPLMYGGGHERGLRSGTLPTHQIAAMGEALAIAQQEMSQEIIRLTQLRKRLVDGLNQLGEVYFNGHLTACVPGIVNVSFNYIDADALMAAIMNDLAVSSGSACTTASLEPSHVLKALGLPDVLSRAALRLSFGRFTTSNDIDVAVECLVSAVKSLRKLSPLGKS